MDIQAFIKRADSEMYRAKKAGKNCISVAEYT
jgi:PleD family two-component response regulator